MFTWNFPYISKARLADTLDQLSLNQQKGDVLIRIHTAIHPEDEAVELAAFIKDIVPRAKIYGTSTSAVISQGKLLPNQCVISVSLMSPQGKIESAFLPAFDKKGVPINPDTLSKNVKEAVIKDDTRLLFTFLTDKYKDVYEFVEKCNENFPGVQMTGGLADKPDIVFKKPVERGFVFNEKKASNKVVMVASISGRDVESFSSYSTGVQVIGDEIHLDDTFGTCVLSVDGKDTADIYKRSLGEAIRKKPEMAELFPYVYSDTDDFPVFVHLLNDTSIEEEFPKDDPAYQKLYEAHKDHLDTSRKCDLLIASHNVMKGRNVRRAFIYDRKIISDDRALFRSVENFEKAETIISYSCKTRAKIYSNCARWEISAYENSNICGCVTNGEIAFADGRNVYANCAFVVSVVGEAPATQELNPYVFTNTDSLADDNTELLNYLMDVEEQYEKAQNSGFAEGLKEFVRGCEAKLLFSEMDEIPNAAAMNMDMSIRGYDRMCIINVSGTSSMRTVFPTHLIDLTYRNYIKVLNNYSKENNYRFYIIDKWQVAIGAPSYMVSLNEFASKMELLQRKLFESSGDLIAIVPTFCVINECTPDNIFHIYNYARLNMMNRNIQFFISDASSNRLDEEKIKDQYHMVNVINYAIAHDKVIPYFQGINDNKTNKIHHYEALMRLEDEHGNVYMPGSFLDVARNFGLLYDSISMMMLRKIFETFKNSKEKSVSINIGMRDIRNREITEYIYAFLSTAKYPRNFIFEILENEDIDDYDVLMSFVDRIHSLGALISIDDFGSGYSNLQHVLSIHLDYLKLDGSIVKSCTTSKQSENLIALISGWKKLTDRDIRIVAEYVENKNIQKLLMKYGIDFSQGFLFAKPDPEVDLDQ